MPIRDVALALKKWAQANQMIGFTRQAPPVDAATIRTIFGRAGVPAATHILQDRGISYIGINELKDEIIVFTRKKLTVKDARLLESATYLNNNEKYTISFKHGNVPHAGPSANPPTGIAPFHKINDRYTCGSSVYIGSEKGAGTLGCLVRDKVNGVIYGLSNNHVTGGSNYAEIGLPIVAPGALDVAAGGMDPTTLGHHADSYPFVDGIPESVDADKNLDAAIFTIADHDVITSMQRAYYDTPSNFIPMEIGMKVTKVGRTTGKTNGEVVAELPDYEPIIYDLDIIGGKKIVYYGSLFAITGDFAKFCEPGDSGSLIVTKHNDQVLKAVGIVIAADDNGLTFALSIDRILNYFNVELVSGHNT